MSQEAARPIDGGQPSRAVDTWTDRRLGPRRLFDFLRSRIPPGQTEATVSAADIRAAFHGIAESTLRTWRSSIATWGVVVRPGGKRGTFIVSIDNAGLRLVSDGQRRLPLPPDPEEPAAQLSARVFARDSARTPAAAPHAPSARARPPDPIPRKTKLSHQSTNSNGSKIDPPTPEDPGAKRFCNADTAALILALAKTDPAQAFDRYLGQIYHTVPKLQESKSGRFYARAAARLVANGDVPPGTLSELLVNIRDQRWTPEGLDESNGASLFVWSVKRWPQFQEKCGRKKPHPRENDEPP